MNGKTADTTKCLNCKIGMTSKAGASTCDNCREGTFGSESGVCTDCPQGWHTSQSGSSFCLRCGTGTKGETTSGRGSSVCNSCDLGKHQTIPGVCENCPVGQYASDKGEKSCTKCDVDTYLTEEGKSWFFKNGWTKFSSLSFSGSFFEIRWWWCG